MSIPWSKLPKDVITKICMCSVGANKKGFSLDPATGYWTHTCGKPSVLVAVCECDICGKIFVPQSYEKAKYKDLGVMCDDCDGTNSSEPAA
jgi:hypothetical protein